MSQKLKTKMTDFNLSISQRLGLTYRSYDKSDGEALLLLVHWQTKTNYDYEIVWDSKLKEHAVTLIGKNYGLRFKGLTIRDTIITAFRELYLSDKS